MLDGWYCRSIANMQASEAANASNASSGEHSRTHDQRKDYSSDSSSSEAEPDPNYKLQYQALKKKLKFLIYENECFQDALRCSQKRLLKVSRDRTFLLDRLLQYEKPESTSSESEDTESSDDASYNNPDISKRKKIDTTAGPQVIANPGSVNKNVNNAIKRKRAVVPKKTSNTAHPLQGTAAILAKSSPALGFGVSASDGHMTPEEVERHLQSRQSYLELLPERAPPTVPTEMFSNDPSLDRFLTSGKFTDQESITAIINSTVKYFLFVGKKGVVTEVILNKASPIAANQMTFWRIRQMLKNGLTEIINP